MQHGAEVAQNCTQSEPLRDRDGCPHRAGLRVRGGANLGCWGGRRLRQFVGCVDRVTQEFIFPAKVGRSGVPRSVVSVTAWQIPFTIFRINNDMIKWLR